MSSRKRSRERDVDGPNKRARNECYPPAITDVSNDANELRDMTSVMVRATSNGHNAMCVALKPPIIQRESAPTSVTHPQDPARSNSCQEKRQGQEDLQYIRVGGARPLAYQHPEHEVGAGEIASGAVNSTQVTLLCRDSLALNAMEAQFAASPGGPQASIQWLQRAHKDLSRPPVSQIPGIPKDSRLQIEDPDLLMVPNALFHLRSFNPHSRLHLFRDVVLLGRAMMSNDPQDPKFQSSWDRIKDIMTSVLHHERVWYESFVANSKAQAEVEFREVLNLQMLFTPVVPPRTEATVLRQDQTRGISAKGPMAETFMEQPRDLEYDIPSAAHAVSTTASKGSAKSSEQGLSRSWAVRKRKDQLDIPDEHLGKRTRLDVDLTEVSSSSKPKVVNEAQYEANLAEYMELEKPINEHYLKGDPSRKKTDLWWKKLAEWKRKGDDMRKRPAQTTQPASTPVDQPRSQTLTAQPQRRHIDGDVEVRPTLPSRELADWPELPGKKGVYRSIISKDFTCGTPECKYRHKSCINGYKDISELEKAVEKEEQRVRSQIERWIIAGKLSPLHKTWVGNYDSKLAKANGQPKLLVEPLKWTERSRKKAHIHANQASLPAPVARAAKPTSFHQPVRTLVSEPLDPVADETSHGPVIEGHKTMSSFGEQRSDAAHEPELASASGQRRVNHNSKSKLFIDPFAQVATPTREPGTLGQLTAPVQTGEAQAPMSSPTAPPVTSVARQKAMQDILRQLKLRRTAISHGLKPAEAEHVITGGIDIAPLLEAKMDVENIVQMLIPHEVFAVEEARAPGNPSSERPLDDSTHEWVEAISPETDATSQNANTYRTAATTAVHNMGLVAIQDMCNSVADTVWASSDLFGDQETEFRDALHSMPQKFWDEVGQILPTAGDHRGESRPLIDNQNLQSA